ncbi:MAG: hypothetical protein L6U16_01800 [Porphyromonadaceae bacterium]|nr:MAG: hypothetical protein L6U16_01800 [Porphyromonadaceae bacterium]
MPLACWVMRCSETCRSACPYVMTQFVTSPIVADIIHRICQAIGSGACIIKASAAKLFMKENMLIR